MSWHNLSGKEFDSKIKAHFEGMEVPFAEPSWELMSKKLDTQGDFKKNHAGNNRWLLGLILIGASVFFWNLLLNTPDSSNIKRANFTSKEIVSNAQDIPAQNQVSSQKSQQQYDEDQSQEPTATDVDPIKVDPIKSEGSQQTDSESAAPLQSPLLESSNTPVSAKKVEDINKSVVSDIELQGTESINDQNLTTKEVSKTSVSHTEVDSSNEQKIHEPEDHVQSYQTNRSSDTRITPISDDTTSDDTTSDDTISDDTKQDAVTDAHDRVGGGNAEHQSRGWTTFQLLSPRLPELHWMELGIGHLPDQVNLVKVEAVTPIVTPPQPRWSIGVGYAPDLSLVGFSEITKPGTNVALNVDYRLGNRWSVQAGATIAKKNYIADGEDYSPPAGFWDYGMIPDQADATCTVIDIPINVRYYFGRKNNWYAATGLSTYLMLRENYDYQYDHNYPGTVDNWAVRNENQHFLGVYNLSIGYQKQLASRWFLEIEPFIKAPISGIGFGRVGLWSTGTLFSIRYQIPKNH